MESGGFAGEVVEEALIYPHVYSRQVEAMEGWYDAGSYEHVLVSGAGDSYAASITGTYLAGVGEPVDPRELGRRKGGRNTLIIAVSLGGRTRSLVESVKRHREAGSRVISVTGNRESPLARLADSIVEVVHKKYVRGSGFASYISMSAAVAGILGLEDKPGMELSCRGDARLHGTPFMVGENEYYGLAYFTMLKMHEDLGLPSRCERLEQFMHATIFSLQDYEQPVILAHKHDVPGRLLEILEETGHDTVTLDDLIYPQLPRLSEFICAAQSLTHAVARMIRERGLSQPYYRTKRRIADELARIIYG